MFANVSSRGVLVEATLVEEDEVEVIVASIAEQERPWWKLKRTWIILLVVAGLAIALGVTVFKLHLSEPLQTR